MFSGGRSIKWIKTPDGDGSAASARVEEVVSAIAEDVRARGMDAVREYAEKFDAFGGPFAVSREAAQEALESLDPRVRASIETAISNVRRFHALQRETLQDREWELSPGVRAGFRYVPMQSVGIYVPGGRYPLPSSAIMGVVPAREAGVKRIAAFSPPGRDGGIHPATLATLALLEVDEIWALGGVQAVAAMAFGAGEIARVDFVAGPGNAYVAEAKRRLFGEFGIDGVAGPSEVLILADEGADHRLVARDLLAQSEHDPMARAVLVAASDAFAEKTLRELENVLQDLPTREVAETAWRNNGAIGVAALDDALAYANATAPEHLQLALADPRAALARCTAYGAAFLGYSSSEVFGDYIAGTNHTLPTAGRARFSSGLWTGSFLRTLTHLDLTPAAAAALASPGAEIAAAEGLAAHAGALRARKEKFAERP